MKQTSTRALILAFCAALSFQALAQDGAGSDLPIDETDAPHDVLGLWSIHLYVDAGYGASSTEPGNQTWRSKSTTFKLDSPQINMALAGIRKMPDKRSRWGMKFGLQTGVDTEALVPSPPPAANEPVSNADTLRHLFRANVSYLFSDKRGIRVTGGLINSFVGFESYLAIENPTYTRGYIVDTVPYFMVGVETAYSPSDAVDLGFYVVTGYNYLANPNDDPSFGLRFAWKPASRINLRQNFYYGPDQADTSREFWRFLSNTIVSWETDRFLLAGAFNYGSEKQVAAGQPGFGWTAGSIWARWSIGERWRVALRPEFLSDDDGLATGFRQQIRALTASLRYAFRPARHHRTVAILEVRSDRSTGVEGGFYSGPDNELVERQNLVLLGLLWAFER